MPQPRCCGTSRFWRTRHGAPGRGARAHLPRSLLERVLRRSRRSSTKPRARTTRALYAHAGRHACGLRAVRRHSIRTRSTTRRSLAQGQAHDAGAGGRRREVVRHHDGRWSCAIAATDVSRARSCLASGHWLMEENPTVHDRRSSVDFLVARPSGHGERQEHRLEELRVRRRKSTRRRHGHVGASAGIRTIVLKGDPTKRRVSTRSSCRVPATPGSRRIDHPRRSHRHGRVRAPGTSVTARPSIRERDQGRCQPAASTPSHRPTADHFAETREQRVMVQITGVGPTGTTYVEQTNNPAEVNLSDHGRARCCGPFFYWRTCFFFSSPPDWGEEHE